MLQPLLNLAEFMELVDNPLPIDIGKLGALAEKCHAYAKALHYREVELHCTASVRGNPKVLESLVALVYGGGFIVMTPQLFINYRLKSVAHLPWKFFMYKALNTFIDDLFAFIIKMPTLHRMSCFRDDIVFAIFMYIT